MRLALYLLTIFPALALGASWTSTDRIPGVRQATAQERAEIIETLKSKYVRYNFDNEGTRVMLHEGDLRVDGHLSNGELFVVRGDLELTGMYDDYRDGIGVLVVLGDLRLRDAYSWGAIHVSGDLKASGTLMTVYNDFTFEVDGSVDARALVISDKSAHYKAGRIDVTLTDDSDEADIENALRKLEPEAFTHPDNFEPYDGGLHDFRFDESYARRRLTEGESIFRAKPATNELVPWVKAALDTNADSNTLAALLGKDRLVDQVIASREKLPTEIAERLAAGGDPIVLAWLARTAPASVLGQGPAAMTPEVASALVREPGTRETDLARIAAHPDPSVRLALAAREELSDALINRLARDADARVRASILGAQFNVLALEPAVLAERLADDAQPVRDALSTARMDAAQARALLPSLSDAGVRGFAESLLRQVRGSWPSAMSTEELRALALQVIDRKLRDAITPAYMALPAAGQRERFDALLAAGLLDLERIAEESNDLVLIRRLLKMADEHGQPMPYRYGENPFLSPALQLEIVARAERSKPETRGSSLYTHDAVLERLIASEHITDAALIAVTELAFARGINPFDGGVQNALFHQRNLPPKAIERIDARLRHNEDWALTVILQRRSSVEQLRRAVPRWYSDPELRSEFATIAKREDADFFVALAQASNPDLREVAAWNLGTPEAEVVKLTHDPVEGVAYTASVHPKLPKSERIRLLPKAAPDAYENIELDAKTWRELGSTLPTRAARIAALEQAARREMRAIEE